MPMLIMKLVRCIYVCGFFVGGRGGGDFVWNSEIDI